jgi:hypothetical protein
MPRSTDKTESRGITAPEVRKHTHKIARALGPRLNAKHISPERDGKSNPELLAGLEIRLSPSKQRAECVSNRNFPHGLRSRTRRFSTSLRPLSVRVTTQDCHQIAVRYGKIGDCDWNVAGLCASNWHTWQRLVSEIRPVVKDS